ncbi:hypothetical protein [Brachybacterium alimentarium]|uniref:hypothetical protein n=1 Tax=Brachybacterium alimentarium TaxID=47845 RepID=UPI000DF43A3F|nr:hypothetical protein [Brachybacterium alimentarium]RCS81836.1 hypothetical protein CIK67_15680 [Brachybacterium alimentarium]
MSTNGRLFWRNTDDIDPISVLEALAREQGDAWEARQFAALWKETARRAISDRDCANMASQSFRKVGQEQYERALKAERERDEAVERAASASPRPLTADDITDEMVERGRSAYWGDEHTVEDIVRSILTAALTEPPTRPEGAEFWESVVADQVGGDLAPDAIRTLADTIAQRSARVTGAES